jgi:hypothetical protein
VASSLDAQKKASEAILKYEELRRRYPTDAIVEEARLCLARLYEDENRMEEALQIYEELAQTHAGSGMGAEAGLRREDLLKRFPQLAKTNLPPISPITPPLMTLTNVPSALTNQALSNPPAPLELKTISTPTSAPPVPVPVPNNPPPAPTNVAPVPTNPAPVPKNPPPVPTNAAPVPTNAAPVPTNAAPAPTNAAPVPTNAAPAPTNAVPAPPG